MSKHILNAVFYSSLAAILILLKAMILLNLVKYIVLYSWFRVSLISGKGYLFLMVKALKL